MIIRYINPKKVITPKGKKTKVEIIQIIPDIKITKLPGFLRKSIFIKFLFKYIIFKAEQKLGKGKLNQDY